MASHRKYCVISKHSMHSILEVQAPQFPSIATISFMITFPNQNNCEVFNQKRGNFLKKNDNNFSNSSVCLKSWISNVCLITALLSC